MRGSRPLVTAALRPARIVWALALLALVAPGLLFLGIAAHFWRVTSSFASYVPEQPSRLYAAPLVLQAGAPIDRQTLAADLAHLGYRDTAGVTPTAGEL